MGSGEGWQLPAVLEQQYHIAECLTPGKQMKTFTAFPDNLWCSVIMKEVNEGVFDIYKQIADSGAPHVAQIHEFVQADDRFFVVTECIGDESLVEYLQKCGGKLSEDTALRICIQICDALKSVHEKGIIHRDIKPWHVMIEEENVSVKSGVGTRHEPLSSDVGIQHKIPDSGIGIQPSPPGDSPFIKLIDFSESFDLKRGKPADIVGTPGFQAPESLIMQVSPRTDVYSTGCVLNYMLTGYEPGVIRYRGDRRIELIIEKALDIDPANRFASAAEFARQLGIILRMREGGRGGVLSKIPGFRSRTWWKMMIATAFYLAVAACWVYSYRKRAIYDMITIPLFWLILPVTFFFDLTGLVSRLERRLRMGPVASAVFRTAFVILCFETYILIANFFTLYGWRIQ